MKFYFKKIVIIVFFISLNSSYASNFTGFIKGDGRFYAMDEDSLAFVKKQLLQNAFKKVIAEELKNENLDPDLFFEKFDKKFEVYFEDVFTKLKEKYQSEDETIPDLKKVDYQRELRIKRLSHKAKFGKLNSVIHSYSIKRMTRSTQVPNSRYIQIIAKVDKKALNDIYYKFTRTDEKKVYKNLFLSADFKVENISWADVGVEFKSDFTTVVMDHWKKWLAENLLNYIGNVKFVTLDVEKKLNDFFNSPQGFSKNILDFNSKEEVLAENVQVEEEVDKNFSDSLWLKIEIRLKRIKEDLLMGTRQFSFSGDLILVDLNSNRVLSFYDFTSQEASYSILDGHKLSSNIASLVYRLPLDRFRNFSKIIAELPTESNRVEVSIQNLHNIKEVFDFNSMLANQGVTLGVAPSIKSYDGSSASVLVNFHGDFNRLKSVLEKMDGLNLDTDKKVKLAVENRPYRFYVEAKTILEKSTLVPEINKLKNNATADERTKIEIKGL